MDFKYIQSVNFNLEAIGCRHASELFVESKLLKCEEIIFSFSIYDLFLSTVKISETNPLLDFFSISGGCLYFFFI